MVIVEGNIYIYIYIVFIKGLSVRQSIFSEILYRIAQLGKKLKCCLTIHGAVA